ncbi:MFS transporter [Alphaproteobacteria bacterium]|nr:MFS transporter [Alphaproteobacteria bacterium]
MRLLISLSALLISTFFVQMGIGSLRPFDAISGQVLGFTPVEIGFLASGHFAGFLLGCIFSPIIVRRAGHSRAFALMAGIAIISIIAHPIYPEATFWTAIRLLSGFSVAGCYTLIESWLQAKATNEIRGRLFSVYRIIDMSGQLMANAMIATLTPASYISYNIIAIVMCLSILPLALTQSKEPELPETVSYQPLFAYHASPLAALGVVVAGLSTATFGSVGPIYALAVGLDISQIALFLVVSIIGGMLSQFPAGLLADRLSRRVVLLALSIMASVLCMVMTLPLADMKPAGIPLVYVLSFLFGLTTFPIYSICAAHASDFVDSRKMMTLSASLIFFYASGAIVSPLIAGWIIAKYGAPMMFSMISAAHVALMLYTIWRYFARPTLPALRRYAYVPRTSMFIASILRPRRSRNKDDHDKSSQKPGDKDETS